MLRLAPIALVLAACALSAADPAVDPACEAKLAALPPGVEVIAPGATAWKLKNGGPEVGAMSVVDVAGMPFATAIRMESRKRTDRDYMFQAITPTIAPLAVDDIVLLTFYARATQVNYETGMGQVVLKLFSMKQQGTAVAANVAVTTDWQKFYCASRVFSKQVKSFAPGEMTMTMNQGLPPQTVEIADIRVVKYPAGVTMKDMPRMVVTYDGREPDAAWRRDAIARIERIRKGDLAVRVVDREGRPVPGAQVGVHMRRHAFGFGSAYADPRITDWNDEDSQRYRAEFRKLFNVAVSESGMKWEPWLEERERAIRAAAWMREHNIPVRGHTLVWCQLDRLPYAKKKPEIMERYRKDLDGLQRFQLDHIRDEMTALKGQCFAWDLINEPMTHWDYANLMGMRCFLDYFKLAHEIDPQARLLVNENKLLNSDGGMGRVAFSREDDFYTFLKYLKDNGAPLAGIGIQSHWGGALTPPVRMLQQLDRFAEFGSISITEFDVVTEDEELQADCTRDFMTMAFSHPAIDCFVMWGFWDGQHFRKNAPLFRRDWSLKPSGAVYKDLVFKQWWTEQDGAADASGTYAARGFLGDYEVTASVGERRVVATVALAASGAQVTLTLE